MILTIDTSKSEEIEIGVIKEKKEIVLKGKARDQKAQITLLLIDKLLKDKKLNLEDFKRIEVKTRGESYTGLRVGVSIANALSFALNVPVNGKKVGDYENPKY